jgi:superfamily II DNA/RNA helicase
LPFSPEADSAVTTLLGFLHSGKIEVRLYNEHFLHAKAFLFRGPDRGVISGSSNLTRGGLRWNLELNLGHYEDPLTGRVEQWFDDLWERAAPFDLAAIYEELFELYPPYLVYLKVLWHLYGAELEEEQLETGEIPVTHFQKHGVWRARRILEMYGGVLIADGVGLGKTYTAGAIMREYRDRRQRVLLICPASLRDTSWEKFLNDFQLLVESVSYEQLAGDAQLGGEKHHLRNPLEDYALVVIDEAHNYRNPDAPMRAGVLRKLLMGRRRDLVLLTATPVNNSLWDLYQVLRYFLKQDAALANRGVLSVRGRFEEAMRTDPFDLNPDLLYPIIDATTVKRTRRFVKKHYAHDMIKGPDGSLQPIRFPKPLASSINYDLEQVLPGFLDRLEQVLMPPSGRPLLRMARYQPERYLHAGAVPDDSALVGLLRSALLKRFESSEHALSRTLSKMIDEHEAFLSALDQGYVVQKEFFREVSAAEEDDEIEEILEASENAFPATDYDVEELRADVQTDLALLRELQDEVAEVKPEASPKLEALVEELASVADQARKESIDEEDERQKRKVLVFSHYKDTVSWIQSYLEWKLEEDDRLACYRGRMAAVSGSEDHGGIAREDAIHGFAPITTGALPGTEDQYDILLSTDVLAEGMNLQQSRNVINYDLPWNPMRLVQRHGRIDRIGSSHREVFLRTFFPDLQLDALLNLEERVRRKLAQAAASVGVEEAPIERGAIGEQTFAETREEIERLHREDATIYERGGTEGAAQTGEEYRQELRKAVQDPDLRERIITLPWRIGSGMKKGDRTGHFFCATVADRVYLRFVPADPEAEIVSELGTCLRLIECIEDTQAELSEELKTGAYVAWERARQSIHKAWSFETDPANLQPKVRPLNRQVAAFMRENPPADVDQDRLHRALDAIETPWSRREENQLREVWNTEFAATGEKAKALIECVEAIGVEPFLPPEPLPPIDPEEIHLVCWLGIAGGGGT